MCMHVACSCGSVLLWRRCDRPTLCRLFAVLWMTSCSWHWTSGQNQARLTFRRVRQVAVPVERQTTAVLFWVRQVVAPGAKSPVHRWLVFYCYWLIAVDSTELCQFRAHYDVVSFHRVWYFACHSSVLDGTSCCFAHWLPASYPTLCYKETVITKIRALPSGTANFVPNSGLRKILLRHVDRRECCQLSTDDRRCLSHWASWSVKLKPLVRYGNLSIF